MAVEVLVLFLKIMSKSVTIRNPFPASSASQEGSVGEVSVQVDLNTHRIIIIIVIAVIVVIIIIILSGGLVHTPRNWRAQSHLER